MPFHVNLLDAVVLSVCTRSLVRALRATGVDRQLSVGFPPGASMTYSASAGSAMDRARSPTRRSSRRRC